LSDKDNYHFQLHSNLLL